MISYEVYKTLHVFSVVLGFMMIGLNLLHPTPHKAVKIFNGVATVLILVAGMGLLARLNMPHGEPWPLWVKVKLGIWIVFAIGGPVVSKRMKSGKGYAVVGFLALALIAIVSAVFKY